MIQPRSLLLVDDDTVFRARLARALRARNIEVGEADSISSACEYVSQYQPEASVIDLRLQDESGMELVKSFPSLAPGIKLIVLTGYGTIRAAVEALKLGAINYLTKPIDVEGILEAFRENYSEAASQLVVPPLQQVEWEHIQKVVNDCNGNITKASKLLGMHRRSLQRKLAKRPDPLY